MQLAGSRFRYATCPTQLVNRAPHAIVTHRAALWAPSAAVTSNDTMPVCATEIYMMPSSRVEVWATYTDAQNRLAQAPAGQTATLTTLRNAGERFDPAHEICLPLGPGDTPRNEGRELVNLSGELHNFHIHQTKFKVLRSGAAAGTLMSATSGFGEGVMENNVPLSFAAPAPGYELPPLGAGAVADYRAAKCLVKPVLVKIPFARLGLFVFHGHILEHEDGGMMHAIRIVKYQ